MSRPGNLCICNLCLVLLVGTASAATAFPHFVAYGDARQSTNNPILSIIANRVNEPSPGWFAARYTGNEGKVIPTEASVPIIPHGEEKIAMMAVRER